MKQTWRASHQAEDCFLNVEVEEIAGRLVSERLEVKAEGGGSKGEL